MDDYLIFPEYDQIVVNYEVDINLPFIGYKKKIKTSAVIGAHGEVIHDNIRFKISAVTFYDSTHTGLTLYSDQMKEGYLNLEQELVIPPWYDFVMVDPNEPNFINIVSEKGEGFYWKDRLILEPIYDAVRPTEHLDYAGEANLENVWDYVEHSGKLILKNTKWFTECDLLLVDSKIKEMKQVIVILLLIIGVIVFTLPSFFLYHTIQFYNYSDLDYVGRDARGFQQGLR